MCLQVQIEFCICTIVYISAVLQSNSYAFVHLRLLNAVKLCSVHVHIIYLLECYNGQMCKCVYHEVLQLYTLAQLYRFVQLSSASALQLLNGAIERMRRPDRRLAGTSIIGASRCICKIKNNSKTYHV